MLVGRAPGGGLALGGTGPVECFLESTAAAASAAAGRMGAASRPPHNPHLRGASVWYRCTARWKAADRWMPFSCDWFRRSRSSSAAHELQPRMPSVSRQLSCLLGACHSTCCELLWARGSAGSELRGAAGGGEARAHFLLLLALLALLLLLRTCCCCWGGSSACAWLPASAADASTRRRPALLLLLPQALLPPLWCMWWHAPAPVLLLLLLLPACACMRACMQVS